jgi:hypothetical protein
LDASSVFRTEYSEYFKPYVNLAWIVFDERNLVIPGVGLQHDFALQNDWIKPFYSVGVGYAFMHQSDKPGSNLQSQSRRGESFAFTAQTGADFYLSDEWALGLTLRYDGYNIDTTVVDNNQITTLQDRGALSVLFGVSYHFSEPPKPVLDDDKDGVINPQDLCPGTLLNVPVNEAGCPQYRFNINLDFKFATYKFEDLVNHASFNSIEFLQKNTHYSVRIIGYTDNRGRQAFNQRLSQKRADEAKQHLIDEGIEASRISVLGRGEREALFENDSVEHREANRRIKIEFYRTELGAE